MIYISGVGASGISPVQFPLYVEFNSAFILNLTNGDRYLKCYCYGDKSGLKTATLKDCWLEFVDMTSHFIYKLDFSDFINRGIEFWNTIYGYHDLTYGFAIPVFTKVFDSLSRYGDVERLSLVRSSSVDKYTSLAYCCMQPSKLMLRVNKRNMLYIKGVTPELKMPFKGDLSALRLELMKIYIMGNNDRIIKEVNK